MLQLRDQLKHETLGRAVDRLAGAERIELCALGPDGVVADDARLKFLRLGLPSASCSDEQLQPLVAALLKPSHVLVLISSGGPVNTLLALADTARQRGATVMAICGSQSLLVRKADVALTLDHDENLATQLAMVSRILQLLLIDILAVGVALKNGGQALTALTAAHTADPPGRGGDSTKPPPAAAKAAALGTPDTGASHRPGLPSR
ncbi:MAG: SIS domain-containing protein [Rubrivivax sp.]|nr:SIS domain-containing protein [Rubrivivax sp.]